jgi:hypothetical protein
VWATDLGATLSQTLEYENISEVAVKLMKKQWDSY